MKNAVLRQTIGFSKSLIELYMETIVDSHKSKGRKSKGKQQKYAYKEYEQYLPAKTRMLWIANR